MGHWYKLTCEDTHQGGGRDPGEQVIHVYAMDTIRALRRFKMELTGVKRFGEVPSITQLSRGDERRLEAIIAGDLNLSVRKARGSYIRYFLEKAPI